MLLVPNTAELLTPKPAATSAMMELKSTSAPFAVAMFTTPDRPPLAWLAVRWAPLHANGATFPLPVDTAVVGLNRSTPSAIPACSVCSDAARLAPLACKLDQSRFWMERIVFPIESQHSLAPPQPFGGGRFHWSARWEWRKQCD